MARQSAFGFIWPLIPNATETLWWWNGKWQKSRSVHIKILKHFTSFFLFLSHCNFWISETPDLKIPAKLYIPITLKHWPYTMAHTIDCVCSKLLNHGLFLSLLKLIPYPIHWIVYVSAYSEVPNKRVTFSLASLAWACWEKCNKLIRNFRVFKFHIWISKKF